ncbi:unnamed protein product, partial [Oikopleura dioica]
PIYSLSPDCLLD